MKDTIQVEIISPTQAKELNLLGEKPEKFGRTFTANSLMAFNEYLQSWKESEANRRVFEIENNKQLLTNPPQPFYKIGSIHTAEIIEGTNKCIII
jgi:hypothetical protein